MDIALQKELIQFYLICTDKVKRADNNEKKSSCYLCDTSGAKYRQQVDERYSIIKCTNCGLEYTYPVPSEEELKTFYSQYKDIRAEQEIVELNSKEHLKVLSKYGWKPNSKTLDFGTGKGVFVEMAGNCSFGIDLNPSSNPRIKLSLEDELNNVTWDFITLFGVLEHLPKPLQTMSDLVSRLRKGGIIAITTINAEGSIPYYHKPPEHLTYWTRVAFNIMCNTFALKIIEYKPYWMFQRGEIYLERLLSRTPDEYRQLILNKLPKIVHIPTNELFCLLRKE